MMKHAEVTPLHFILAMLECGDVRWLLRRAGLDVAGIHSKIRLSLGSFPTIEGDVKLCLSADLNKAVDRAIDSRAGKDRTKDPLDIDHMIRALQHVGVDLIPAHVAHVFQHDRARDAVLLQYGTDLTRHGEEMFGRQRELQAAMRVLSKYHRPLPLIVGEEGVGKTAILHGLARHIQEGGVAEALRGKRIILFNVASLTAGTSLRGELEDRVGKIFEVLKDYQKQIILAFDDIHNLLQTQAFGLCVGPLSRGEVQAVATTTPSQYMKHRDVLSRLFDVITISAPSTETTLQILQGRQGALEKHHRVRIHSDALNACVTLTSRYVASRPQPSVALDALDAACAGRRALNDQPPPGLLDLNVTIQDLYRALDGLDRDRNLEFVDVSPHLRETILGQIREREAERTRVEWMASLVRVARENASRAFQSGDHEKLREALQHLKNLGVDSPTTAPDVVVREDVARVVSDWTGVPITKMGDSDLRKLAQMEGYLQRRVKGQHEAVVRVCSAVRQARAGLADPDKPIGSFLFMGPTGVGKTELAKALAEFLFDDEDAMVRLDMSEYMEKHSATRLIGSPPGYVGYEQGGQLTEAVRQRPYTVVLFDEMEKAHPDVLTLLLQVLDEGRLTDSRGVLVDFRNTIVILTTNVGAEASFLDEEAAKQFRDEALRRTFRPEFLNRLDGIVPFVALRQEHMRDILAVQLRRLNKRLFAQKLKMVCSEEALNQIAQMGYDPKFGARPLKRVIQDRIIDPLSSGILAGSFTGPTIYLDVEDGELQIR